MYNFYFFYFLFFCLKIKKKQLEFDGLVSYQGADFIMKLLSKNPKERMKLSEAFIHPFVNSEAAKRIS